jgi:hypothetical protein
LGEITLPVELRVFFDDGTAITEWWDGTGRNATFTYKRGARILKAAVDPEGRIPADVNVINNSMAATPSTAPAHPFTARLVFWLQTLLQFVGTLG